MGISLMLISRMGRTFKSDFLQTAVTRRVGTRSSKRPIEILADGAEVERADRHLARCFFGSHLNRT